MKDYGAYWDVAKVKPLKFTLGIRQEACKLAAAIFAILDVLNIYDERTSGVDPAA